MEMKRLAIQPNLYVIFGIAMSAAAQVFLKISGSYEAWRIKWYCFIGASLLSYAFAFFSYYVALKYFEVSRISPVMMASVVSIVALYGLAVGEHMNHLKIAGIVMAIISIVLISKS